MGFLDAIKATLFGPQSIRGPLGPLTFHDFGSNSYCKGHRQLGADNVDLIVWAGPDGPSEAQIDVAQAVVSRFMDHRAVVVARLLGQGDAEYTFEEDLPYSDTAELSCNLFVTQLALLDQSAHPRGWALTFTLNSPTSVDDFWVLYATFTGDILQTLDSHAD